MGSLSGLQNLITHNYNEIISIGPYSEDAVAEAQTIQRVVVGMPVGTNAQFAFLMLTSNRKGRFI